MKFFSNWGLLGQDLPSRRGLMLLGLLVGSGLIFLAINFSSLPPEVPLFFSRPWGKEQLGQRWQLILLPIFSLIIAIINTLLAAVFIKEERLLARLLVWTAVIVGLVLAVALIKIGLLVA